MRRRHSGRLVVATHNAGKLAEIGALLAPFAVETVSAGSLGLPEPAETGTTFAENARIKAETAAAKSGMVAISDDSGIAIWALHGAPGLFSANWAGPGKDFTPALGRVERELQARGALSRVSRVARFVCALCLAWPDGHVEEVEGTIDGTVVFPPRGSAGFGYDPIFEPAGHTRTFGEMSAHEKHGVDWQRGIGLSHRARAFLTLAEHCLVRR
jgi:XTP/dITP diphosphohydrolase